MILTPGGKYNKAKNGKIYRCETHSVLEIEVGTHNFRHGAKSLLVMVRVEVLHLHQKDLLCTETTEIKYI